jgi:aldehyde dehydrogenase (NAD+)
VFEDADIESAINGCVGGIFGASGQSCVAGSRLYLHEDIADTFLERLTEVAGSIKIGDPMLEETQMGPLCTQGQLDHIAQQVALAKKEGATIRAGGGCPQGMAGQFYEPTIVECPRQDLTIVDTELFGPVVSVLRFRDEDEVLALANDSKHGLAAGIFTRDSARSLRVAKKIKAGIVWVNTYRMISPIAEFGGMKQSGYGRESGFQAVWDYTRPKTVWMNTSSEPLGNMFVAR